LGNSPHQRKRIMNLLRKLILKIKKPVAIGIAGNNKKVPIKMMESVLNKSLDKEIKVGLQGSLFKLIKSEIVLFEIDEEAKFVFQNSSYPILIGTVAGNIPPQEELFASEAKKAKPILKLAKKLPSNSLLVVNYDDETVREIIERDEIKAECLTFGLGKGSDVRASDVQISQKGTSFKLNYEGHAVPVWLKNLIGKRQIYSALVTSALAVKLGLNLVNVTQKIKLFEGVSGEGQLKQGIKQTKILDDSANADPFSMDETLMALSTIKNKLEKETQVDIRKIAVLGDILKVGKYSVEAHQALGKRAAQEADIIFTVGPRAKFIGNEAEIEGLDEENIYHFNNVKNAGLKLQEIIEPGDLILVDGAAEMKMHKIVEEIKKR